MVWDKERLHKCKYCVTVKVPNWRTTSQYLNPTERWCFEHVTKDDRAWYSELNECITTNYQIPTVSYWFENKGDATMFKLRWG